jgi:excisionase family DNA binding protein
MNITEDKLLWSVKETCKQLNIGRTLLMSLTYDGSLPSVKIGRKRMYSPDKVRDWAGNNYIPVADVVEDSPTEVQVEGDILDDAGKQVRLVGSTKDGMDLLEKKVSALERKVKALAASSKEPVEVRLDYITISQLKELEERVTRLEASTTQRLHTAQVEIYEQIALLTVLYDRVAPLLEVKKSRWYSFGRSKKGVE